MDIVFVALTIFVAFLYGISPILQKHVLKTTHVTVVLVLSSFFYFCAAFVYGIYKWNVMRSGLLKISFTQICILVIVAILTAFIANLLFLTILSNHDSYFVVALVSSAPMFTLAFAYFFLQEHINWLSILGVLLIIIGVIMLSVAKKYIK